MGHSIDPLLDADTVSDALSASFLAKLSEYAAEIGTINNRLAFDSSATLEEYELLLC